MTDTCEKHCEANAFKIVIRGLEGEVARLKERLAQEKALQALHSENERLGLYKDAYAKPEYSDIVSDGGLDPRNKFDAPPQRTEQNFCSRCGKRTKDIHTCTPPKD
jgi:hypothetical protein